MKKSNLLLMFLSLFFFAQFQVLFAQNVVQVTAAGDTLSQSELRTLEGVFLKFIVKPNSDTPDSGLVRVYFEVNGAGGIKDCQDCSEDFRLNGNFVKTLSNGEVNTILIDQFQYLEDQVADIDVDDRGNIKQIDFVQLTYKAMPNE